MRNDEDLPFQEKIRQEVMTNESYAIAHQCFMGATNAARKVFDTALGSAKSKAQEEVHAVVAAVYAAAKGEESEINVIAGTGGNATSATPNVAPSNTVDTDDTHLVTLSRLSKAMTNLARECFSKLSGFEANTELVGSSTSVLDIPFLKKESDSDSLSPDDHELPLHKRLPMPDARVMDTLLDRLICHMEGCPALENSEITNGSPGFHWEFAADALVHERARSNAIEMCLGSSKEQVVEERRDFTGIGFNGTQCASTHCSLDDGSDYSLGAASQVLAQVATGMSGTPALACCGNLC
jgi:hypothetical protein